MKKQLLTSTLLLASICSFAQWGSFDLTFGLPRNEFRENTDATGFGADLSFGVPFQKGFPVSFGLDLNYIVYGRNAQDEDLTADVIANNQVIASLNIPLRIVNTNSIFGTHALIRAQAPFELVQPYVEGLIGFRYISTNTKILDRSNDGRYSDNDDNVISRETVLDDWIFSYGYGGGFMIKVGAKFFIDIRADFFKGERAKYYDGEDTEAWTVQFTGSAEDYDPDNLTPGDLTYENEPRESTTDLLMLKFGVAFKF
ncbi:MAG: hypothetical protein RLN88_02580 [Ekhidna sp.]|uniref:hypothetical protein n=1 Tax=Ekhidna sp. TaxID=2608089 RepID=UPI0032ED9CE4